MRAQSLSPEWSGPRYVLPLSFALLALITPSIMPNATPTFAIASTASVASTTSPGNPLLFVQNQGQWPTAARYQVQGGATTLWLTDNAIWLSVVESAKLKAESKTTTPTFSLFHSSTFSPSVTGVNLKLSFVGANPHPTITPLTRLTTHISYFLGHNAATWHTDVPVYDGVRYDNLYPGVDLELRGDAGALQPVLVARAGANLNQVRLKVEGANNLALTGNALRLTTALGAIAFPLFTVATPQGGTDATSVPHPMIVGAMLKTPFASPGHATTDTTPGLGAKYLPPQIMYKGSQGTADLQTMTMDAAGNFYITGPALAGFPTTPGAYQSHAEAIYVAKLDPTGSKMLYATYFGSPLLNQDSDLAYGITVDSAGDIYLAGETYSPTFPVTPGAYQTKFAGKSDAFISKLNATGAALLYSTYLGGGQEYPGNPSDLTGANIAYALAIDGQDNAYVTGMTSSYTFPTTAGAFQTTSHAQYPCPLETTCLTAFATKLNATGTALVYSTYLSGNVQDRGSSIKVDTTGNAYVAGVTQSPNFPTTPHAFQPKYAAGGDIFVMKLNAKGSAPIYATFLGSGDGNLYRYAYVAIDSAGHAYIAGSSQSATFPVTPGVVQPTLKAKYQSSNLVIAKISADGHALLYATYLGGPGPDYSTSLVVDQAGDVFVAAMTYTTKFPVSHDGYQVALARDSTGVVAELNPTATTLLYSTYIASAVISCNAITQDSVGNHYIGGAYLLPHGGFIAKLVP